MIIENGGNYLTINILWGDPSKNKIGKNSRITRTRLRIPSILRSIWTNKVLRTYNHYRSHRPRINILNKARLLRPPSRLLTFERREGPKWKTWWRVKSTRINSGTGTTFISGAIWKAETKTSTSQSIRPAVRVVTSSTAISIWPIHIREREEERKARRSKGRSKGTAMESLEEDQRKASRRAKTKTILSTRNKRMWN